MMSIASSDTGRVGRIRRTRFIAIASAALVIAAPRPTLEAQASVTLDARTNLHRSPGDAPSALTLAPSLRLDRAFATVDVTGLALSPTGNLVGRDLTLRGEIRAFLYTPTRRGLGASVELRGTRSSGSELLAGASAISVARVSYARSTGGAWIGVGAGRNAGAELPPSISLGSAGAWWQRGNLVITTSAASARSGESVLRTIVDTAGQPPFDTIRTRRVSSSRSNQFTDVEVALSWSHGPLLLDAAVGMRPTTPSVAAARWLHAGGAWALTRTVALVSDVGTRPAVPFAGTRAGGFFTLGLELSTSALRSSAAVPEGVRASASEFAIRGAGASRTISVRANGARVVELMADFTDWQPISLARVGGNRFEITMPVAPGVHRVDVRIDGGAWVAPPGTSVVRDEFGGEAGITMVP
jgi:hypothetical protein